MKEGHGPWLTQAGHGVRATQAGHGVRATQAGRSDEELVEAARSGDGDALEALLRRHYPRLLALCRRLTGDPTDAEDACQEALVAVARGLRRFDGRSAFTTWAYRVTTNSCLDELRRRRRRPVPDPGTGRGGEPGGTPTPGPSGVAAPWLNGVTAAPDPGEAVATRLDVDAALAAVAPDFRAAVVLRDLCQLSYEEIAAVLGVPVGTVRSRIARGRAALVPLLTRSPFGHGAGSPFGHGAGSPFGHGAGNPPPPGGRPTS